MDLPNAPFYRRWSFILAGVIGLAAITALLGWRGLAQVASPMPTTTPPTSYGPTSKPDQLLWSKVGSDVARSKGFQAPYAWRIIWSFDCTNFKQLGGGNFKITGNGALNQVDIQAVAVQDSGTQRYKGGGYGQLQIDSVCRRWSVRVLAG
jgi:hypothetical protein